MEMNARLDDGLVGGVGGATPDVRAAVEAGNREVRAAATALRAALAELHESEDEAWRRYAESTDWALVHLDAEMQVAAAQLRAERAHNREELGAALHEVSTTWRARLDDVFVQARLAEMESEDAGHHAIEELVAARHQVESILEHLGSDLTTSFQEARNATLGAVRRVARAVRQIQLQPS